MHRGTPRNRVNAALEYANLVIIHTKKEVAIFPKAPFTLPPPNRERRLSVQYSIAAKIPLQRYHALYGLASILLYNSIGILGGKRVRDSPLATRHVSVFLRPDWCILYIWAEEKVTFFNNHTITDRFQTLQAYSSCHK